MRRVRDGKYTVELAPTVWAQVSVIPREAFRSIQDRMHESAIRLGEEAHSDDATHRTLQLTVDGYLVVCQVNVPMRVLRLIQVQRALES